MDRGDSAAFEIVTPSYAQDFELCRDLVASVRRFAPAGTRHRIIVPRQDRALFAGLGDDLVVETVDEVLPRHIRKIPKANFWVNTRAPWPPIRGWIAQQLVKLSAVANSTAAAVLVVDSDVEFVRPFSPASYQTGDHPALYSMADAVTDQLPRHMLWDDVAHRLLGLPPSQELKRPDYICWPCLWYPEIVRGALRRVEEVTGHDWATSIGREMHFSEMVLYGVYAEEMLAGSRPIEIVTDMHCRNHSDEIALDRAALRRFLAGAAPDDLAVMVSAKSGTALQERRAVIDEFIADHG